MKLLAAVLRTLQKGGAGGGEEKEEEKEEEEREKKEEKEEEPEIAKVASTSWEASFNCNVCSV